MSVSKKYACRLVAWGLAGCLAWTPSTACACYYGHWGFDPDDAHQVSTSHIFEIAKPMDTMKVTDARMELKSVEDRMTRDPDDLMLRNDYAYLLNRTGDRAGAIKAAEEILAKHPDHYPTMCNLAMFYSTLGNYDQAEKWLKKAVSIRPGFRSGAEEYHIRKIEFEKAMRLDPQYQKKHLFLDELTPLWEKRGTGDHNFSTVPFPGINKDGVAELLHQYPKFGEGWLVLGMLFEHDKDYSNALLAYKQAVKTGTGHMAELKSYLEDFEPYVKQHDLAHDIARRIKWLLIFLAVLAVGYWLLRVFSNIVLDLSTWKANKEADKKAKRKMGLPPPQD